MITQRYICIITHYRNVIYMLNVIFWIPCCMLIRDKYTLSLREVSFWCFTGCHYKKKNSMIVLVQHLSKMMIYINTWVHQWVHPSVCALLHCAAVWLKRRTVCIQMQHCSFICWFFSAEVTPWQGISVWQTEGRLIWPPFFSRSPPPDVYPI